MVNSCILCKTKNNHERSYFRIPRIIKHRSYNVHQLSVGRRNKWCNILNIPTDGKLCNRMRICSIHFISGHPAKLEDALNVDWLPTLHLTPSLSTQRSEDIPETQKHRKTQKMVLKDKKPNRITKRAVYTNDSAVCRLCGGKSSNSYINLFDIEYKTFLLDISKLLGIMITRKENFPDIVCEKCYKEYQSVINKIKLFQLRNKKVMEMFETAVMNEESDIEINVNQGIINEESDIEINVNQGVMNEESDIEINVNQGIINEESDIEFNVNQGIMNEESDIEINVNQGIINEESDIEINVNQGVMNEESDIEINVNQGIINEESDIEINVNQGIMNEESDIEINVNQGVMNEESDIEINVNQGVMNEESDIEINVNQGVMNEESDIEINVNQGVMNEESDIEINVNQGVMNEESDIEINVNQGVMNEESDIEINVNQGIMNEGTDEDAIVKKERLFDSSDESNVENKPRSIKRKKYSRENRINLTKYESKNLKCKHCFVNFNSLDMLIVHKNFCTVFYCCLCKPRIMFLSNEEYEKHKLSHTELKVCHVCGKEYSPHYLEKHFNSHFASGKKCFLCGKIFRNLTRHVNNVHNPDHLSVCQVCGASVKNLEKHLKLHLQDLI